MAKPALQRPTSLTPLTVSRSGSLRRNTLHRSQQAKPQDSRSFLKTPSGSSCWVIAESHLLRVQGPPRQGTAPSRKLWVQPAPLVGTAPSFPSLWKCHWNPDPQGALPAEPPPASPLLARGRPGGSLSSWVVFHQPALLGSKPCSHPLHGRQSLEKSKAVTRDCHPTAFP